MKIILISGKAGSGKDTAAEIMQRILEEEYGKRTLITHFGDPVKFVAERFFGWNGKKDEAGRSLLQWIGEKGREYYTGLWADYIAEPISIFAEKWDYVLIPDTRYRSEIAAMTPSAADAWKTKAITVRMECQSPRREMTEEQKKHISEVDLDDYHFDWYINNDGNYAELETNVRILLRNIVKEESDDKNDYQERRP